MAVQNALNITAAGLVYHDGAGVFAGNNLKAAGNILSSTDTNGNISLQPDGTGIITTTSAITVNSISGESTITIGGATIGGSLFLHAQGASDLGEMVVERHTDIAAFGGHQIFARSRGTEASETIVADNDVLSQIVSVGHDGTDFEQAAVIKVEVDGTPGAGDMPGRIVMLTSADGAASPIEGFRLDNAQNVTLANALTVANGGTGLATTTAYAVLCGGTTSTAALQSIAGVGTAAQVLTSNGAAALPTFQAAAGDVSGGGSSTDNALSRWNGTGGDTLQDSTVIVTDNGEMTNASQPAFLVYVNSTLSDVTGDNTQYLIIYDTEVIDQNADFDITTGVFTAPVTGTYQMNIMQQCSGGSGITDKLGFLVTSNLSYQQRGWLSPHNATPSADRQAFSILVDMDASDTASCQLKVQDSGGKIIDIGGLSGGVARNVFSGALIC